MDDKLNDLSLKLIMYETTSGILLNENLVYYSNRESLPKFFYFKTLDEAKDFINSKKRPNTSFEVFDKQNEIIYELDNLPEENRLSEEEVVIKKESKWWKFW